MKISHLIILFFLYSCSSETQKYKRVERDLAATDDSNKPNKKNADALDTSNNDNSNSDTFESTSDEIFSPKESEEIEKVATNSEKTFPQESLEAIIGKSIKWNRGWEKNFASPSIDPKVTLSLGSFGAQAIKYTQSSSAHWGQGPVKLSGMQLPGMAVLLIDSGEYVYGGMFDWFVEPPSINSGWRGFDNIYANNSPWEAEWQAPASGTQCWFLLISWDKKYASNPVSFYWP